MAFPDSDIVEDFDQTNFKAKKLQNTEVWGMRHD
jgi:hypothetical protein